MDVEGELAGRWRTVVVLKRDVLSTIERGRFQTTAGETDAVLRRLDAVPWWSVLLARHLMARERKALGAANTLGVCAPLLAAGGGFLVRGWIDGVALHIARPDGDLAYFRSAKAVLRKLHRAGICHNDLAKEQNWLRGADGRAYLTDFQLAIIFSSRSRLFRITAYEDLRHLLKHKRRYAPAALTPAERRILARKSFIARFWRATVRSAYLAIVRGLFGYADREGGGTRLLHDAPLIAARLRTQPGVGDAVVLAFPNRGDGTGLYAFVEGSASEQSLRDDLAATLRRPPEHLQIAAALPRRGDGQVRSEVLQLIALNQVDQIDALLTDPQERALVAGIVATRRNFGDQY